MGQPDDPAHTYALEVVAGNETAGELERLMCERYLDDRKRYARSGLFRWDEYRATHVCTFLEELRHYKGRWAGQQFHLEPWQRFITQNVFGWVYRDSGHRRFHSAYLEVARKNGKTFWDAGIGLYCLTADNEAGAEVYTAATGRNQARICWEAAEKMARRSQPGEFLHDAREAEEIDVRAHVILDYTSDSKMEAVSAEAKTLEGLGAHCAIIDELHAHANGEVYGSLVEGMGHREQPLIIATTTAGNNRQSFCYQQRSMAINVLRGLADVPDLFAAIYTLDEGDDPLDEAVWRKANPNLGVSVLLPMMRARAAKAANSPTELSEFARKRANVWTAAETRFFGRGKWDACAGSWEAEDSGAIEAWAEARGCNAYAGIDLASNHDLASCCLVFEPEDRDTGIYRAAWKFWLPSEEIEERSRRDGVDFQAWHDAGLLELVPGPVVREAYVRHQIIEWLERFVVVDGAFDPHGNGSALAENIEEATGLVFFKFVQSHAYYDGPLTALESLVLEQRLAHGGHPIASWNADNFETTSNAQGLSMPSKPDRSKTSGKLIDGIVALTMALSRALAVRDAEEEPPTPRPMVL